MSRHSRINHALRLIHINIRCKMSAEVKRQQVDFSPLEHIAMGVIDKAETASQQMLVESMNRDKAQIARMVSRLLRQDLIIKKENPDDKRSVLLSLSSKGKTFLARLDEVELEITTQMLQGFSDEEADALSVLLERLNTNLS